MTTTPNNLKIGLPVFITGNKTFMVKGESKMKKNIFFIIFVFLAASVFAQKFGLDVSLGGSIGIQSMDQTGGIGAEGDVFLPFELGRNDFTGDLKVSSYNYFLLDNMLGAFASISYCPVGGFFSEKINGIESPGASGFTAATTLWELLIGPAFGIDCGSPAIRFQTGAGFHFLGGKTITDKITSYTDSCNEEFVMMGMGLTPQVRIGNDKKICFVTGCDFMFDFAYKSNRKLFWVGKTGMILLNNYSEHIEKFFRFSFRPYFGVGFNF